MELTAAEGRVLGCLIEKQATVPDSYPLTLNALRLACNQTTGRHPVVAYDDRTVEDTLLSLKSKGLARFVHAVRGERTTKYGHRVDERWRMDEAELSVLAVLLLRGPQTVAEVRSRAHRLHAFDDTADVEAVLDTLAARTPTAFVARLDRRAGERETRWAQLLTGYPVTELELEFPAGTGAGGRPTPADGSPSYEELVARVAELERRLASSSPAPTAPSPDHELAEQLREIERRLARIEAELGALLG